MSTIFLMESANLFAGDHDPTASKHLTLAELKLPTLQGMYQEHHAGGSRVQIEVAVGIQKLEPTFKLSGDLGGARKFFAQSPGMREWRSVVADVAHVLSTPVTAFDDMDWIEVLLWHAEAKRIAAAR